MIDRPPGMDYGFTQSEAGCAEFGEGCVKQGRWI